MASVSQRCAARPAKRSLLISSFGVTVLACTAFALCGEPIRPGDTVKVIKGPAPLQVGDEILATLKTGSEFEVIQVQDDWVAVTAEKDGKEITGWIDKSRLRLVAAKDPDSPPKLVNLDKVRPEAGEVKELVGCRVFGPVRVLSIEPNKAKPGMFLIITASAFELRGGDAVVLTKAKDNSLYQVQCLLTAPEETALRLEVWGRLTVAGTVSKAEITKSVILPGGKGRWHGPGWGTLIRLELSKVKTD